MLPMFIVPLRVMEPPECLIFFFDDTHLSHSIYLVTLCVKFMLAIAPVEVGHRSGGSPLRNK